MSVYLFPGERSGAQPPSPPVGAPDGSLGSCSEAKEDEKEEEGDGDTLDSDEFCILDAPGLGIPVCGGQAGQGQGAVGGGSSVPGPSGVPSVREVGGGLCPWGWGWQGPPREAALTLGFEGARGFPQEARRHGILGRGTGIRAGRKRSRWLAGEGRGEPFGCKAAGPLAPKCQ